MNQGCKDVNCFENNKLEDFVRKIILNNGVIKPCNESVYSDHQEFWKQFSQLISCILFDKRNKKKLATYLARVVAQYISICQSKNVDWEKYGCLSFSNETETMPLLKIMEYGLEFYKSVLNQNMAIALSDLAVAWDKELEERHQGIYPSHCVMLLPSDSQNCGTFMFDAEEDPDRRLIFIFVTNKGKYRDRVMICLHELGHYIGCRMRQERFGLFRLMCAMSFGDAVFRKAWAEILYVDEKDIAPSITQNTSYSQELRLAILYSRKLLEKAVLKINSLLESKYSSVSVRDHYIKTMCETISQVFTNNKQEMIDCINTDDKKTNAMVSSEYIEILKNNAGKVIEQLTIKHDMSIEKASTEGTTIMPCNFLERVCLLFAEIASDVFMIRITGIQIKASYFKLIVGEAWKQWTIVNGFDREIPSEFGLFTLSDVFRLRLFAILDVIPSKKLSARRVNGNRQLYQVQNDLINVYKEQFRALNKRSSDCDVVLKFDCFQYDFMPEHDVWNPQCALSRYAETIYRDKLYCHTCESHTQPLSNKEKEIRKCIIAVRECMQHNPFGDCLKRLFCKQ